MGRPALGPAKKQSITVGLKVTPAEEQLLAGAAKLADKPLRTWGREILLREAAKATGKK